MRPPARGDAAVAGYDRAVAPLPDEVRTLLEGPNYGHVATLMPDGSPHSVAVWVGVEDGRIVFFTQSGSRKARNVEGDPRVAVSITDYENPYRTGTSAAAASTAAPATRLFGSWTGSPPSTQDSLSLSGGRTASCS